MFGRLLKPNEPFSNLLEESAAEARHSALLLQDVMAHLGGDCSAQLEAIQQSRRKQKSQVSQITHRLSQGNGGAFDREDVEALSRALHRIPKTIEKVAERMTVCPVKFASVIISEQVKLLDQATREVLIMVQSLRKTMDAVAIQKAQERLQHIEGEGDRILIDLLAGLYNGDRDPIEVIILKDLYEMLERALDRCRDSGNAIFRIALKNS